MRAFATPPKPNDCTGLRAAATDQSPVRFFLECSEIRTTRNVPRPGIHQMGPNSKRKHNARICNTTKTGDRVWQLASVRETMSLGRWAEKFWIEAFATAQTLRNRSRHPYGALRYRGRTRESPTVSVRATLPQKACGGSKHSQINRIFENSDSGNVCVRRQP